MPRVYRHSSNPVHYPRPLLDEPIDQPSPRASVNSARARVANPSAVQAEASLLERRLKEIETCDRTFFDVLRCRQARINNPPSQLTQRLQARKALINKWKHACIGLCLCAAMGGSIWSSLFFQEKVTFGGVPYSIINTFWSDSIARDAYFAGDTALLHDRLRALGIEEAIKDYYRADFATEYELDRHIHQIMFDRTGYVGEAYQVNNYGQLEPITY